MKNVRNFLLICLFIVSCTTQKTVTFTTNTKLKFIGEYDVPYNYSFQNTTVGGLSGIDYDAGKNIYYLICDDRSSINPARFYTAKISLNQRGIDSVQFISVNYLLQRNGTTYPGSKQDPFHTPDPEAIRYNAKTKQLIWSSEGERIIKKDTIVLEDPALTLISTKGKFIDSFYLPPNMRMSETQKGPRQNGVFEGISFIDNYKNLLVSVEEPLLEDGPRAGLNDSSAWIRMIRYHVRTKKPIAQYAYKIDPVAYPATPSNAFKLNGVPDILAVNDHQLLIIERSFSTGRKPSTIKVYIGEMTGATDVSNITSLSNENFTPISKKLLLNMDDLGIYIDNIEGVTFGPKLPNGHQTLIFVADNNFSKAEKMQFLLFEINR